MYSRDDKVAAIAAGEAAGEAAAKRVFRNDGVDGIAKTIGPSGAGTHAQRFSEIWKEPGEDNWQGLALASPHDGVHPYHVRAYDEAFARGARRVCEMLMRGYLDAKDDLPVQGPDGETMADMERKLEVRRRKSALGERPALIWAYEAGHAAYQKAVGRGE